VEYLEKIKTKQMNKSIYENGRSRANNCNFATINGCIMNLSAAAAAAAAAVLSAEHQFDSLFMECRKK
jgi:hypothetical protein